MGIKEINGGIASEYDDQIIWIAKPEEGADAAQIIDESSYTPCKITKIIAHSEFADENEYYDACDEIMNGSTAVATGEIITVDDTYYVEIDATGDTAEYDEIIFDDVTFC